MKGKVSIMKKLALIGIILLLLVPVLAHAQDGICPDGNVSRTPVGYEYNDGSAAIDWESFCWHSAEGHNIVAICTVSGSTPTITWLSSTWQCWAETRPRLVHSITLYTEPFDNTYVPEPGTVLLLITGLGGLAAYSRCKKNR